MSGWLSEWLGGGGVDYVGVVEEDPEDFSGDVEEFGGPEFVGSGEVHVGDEAYCGFFGGGVFEVG